MDYNIMTETHTANYLISCYFVHDACLQNKLDITSTHDYTSSYNLLSRDREVVGSTPSRCTVRQQLWASCQHPCAPVTKQCNLVPAKGRWCSAVGKVTVGLASHWPCGTEYSGLSTFGLNGHGKGDEHPTYAP